MEMLNRLVLGTTLVLLSLAGCDSDEIGRDELDLVISGSRIMDPESGLDAVMNLGIKEGRIEVITDQDLSGKNFIDGSGLVLAPGFIDLHEHAQSDEGYRLMVRDGVTTALELEVGTRDVSGWYDQRRDGQVVNYGVSVGHIPVRMAVMGDEGSFLPTGVGGSAVATDEQIAEMILMLEQGLSQGAVAMGFGMAYTPGATYQEFRSMLEVAASARVSSHIHIRGGVEGVRRTVDLAAEVGASLHVVHANSSGGEEITDFLAVIERAVSSGQDVSTEVYPYGAGMTEIGSALFDDWENYTDLQFGMHQWVATGERLNRESFGEYRNVGGKVIIHGRSEQATRTGVVHPLTMIASDGFVEEGKGHPRTAGTFSKVLGRYVRDEGSLTLMEALRKMTLMPAQRLERAVPQMENKGRIRVGADADLVVFNPVEIKDQSTYEDGMVPSSGVKFVVVNGELVVEQGALIEEVMPGKAVRADLK